MSVEITPRGTHGKGMPKLPPAVYRAFNKFAFRLGQLGVMRTLVEVTTVGARSGLRRTTTLMSFNDVTKSGSWLVVGSAGGDVKHPAWVLNMAAHPDRVTLDMGEGPFRVTPETLKGEERAKAWRHITTTARQFAAYETNTDREIPVVRLTRS